MARIQVSIPEKTAERLVLLSEKLGYPRSQVVTLAIDKMAEEKGVDVESK